MRHDGIIRMMQTPQQRSRERTKKVTRVIVLAGLAVLSASMLMPFAWMLSSSLKTDIEVFIFPVQWIPTNPQWQNYVNIWSLIPLSTFFRNTFILTIVVTTLQVITSSFAAYGFSRMRWRGRDTIFLGYIGTIAVPWQAFMVPQFIMMRHMGLVDTLWSMILLQSFSAFGVFLMRQYCLTIPEELSEAARIDGLSEYGIYARIILPLTKPAIATLVILTGSFVWNDFMGPLIYLSSQRNMTVQIGLRMFMGLHSSLYSYIMAGSVLAILPLATLFFAAQKHFIEGIAATGIKS
ncbi:MAG: carbohydrate ABC transporter permease [Treponema sp.]|nr:carbohydrate ABC transporter permease [Treponema sp.]